MAPLLRWADRVIARMERLSMAVVVLAMLAIMFIMVADVALRYLFAAPLSWAYDFIGEYLTVAVFFLALAQTQRCGEHINVDVVARRLPPRVRSALIGAGAAAAIVLFALIAESGFDMTWTAWQGGEVQPGPVPWPIWASRIFVLIGATLMALRLVHVAVGHLFIAISSLEVRAAEIGLSSESHGDQAT